MIIKKQNLSKFRLQAHLRRILFTCRCTFRNQRAWLFESKDKMWWFHSFPLWRSLHLWENHNLFPVRVEKRRRDFCVTFFRLINLICISWRAEGSGLHIHCVSIGWPWVARSSRAQYTSGSQLILCRCTSPGLLRLLLLALCKHMTQWKLDYPKNKQQIWYRRHAIKVLSIKLSE